MLRRVLTIGIAALVLGLSLGALQSLGSPSDAYAQLTCASHTECNEDDTVTSALTVTHRYDPSGSNDPVEWVSETWKVTAIWATDNTAPTWCDCEIMKTDIVYVDVWADTLTTDCDGCAAGGIEDVDLCSEGKCGSGGSEHFWDYELIVDIDEEFDAPCPSAADPDRTEPAHLYSVTYELNDGSLDGQIVDTANCSLGSQKELRSAVYDNTDYGAFECPFVCADVAGVKLLLEYVDP